jgi:Lon protease-like protein
MEAKVQALPLFPLNVVLFPRQPLPLHIFEQRYRTMIKQCIDNNEPFGVVLAYESDVPAEIGTTARVTDVKRLPDGRMDIMTVGEERFRILNLRESEHGYLIGDVTMLPYTGNALPGQIEELARRTRHYLKLLSEADDVQYRSQFPTTPYELAMFAGIVLNVSLEAKQDLLSHEKLPDLLDAECELLREENRYMSIVNAAVRPPEDAHGFGRN